MPRLCMNMHRMAAQVQATIGLCNHSTREGALANPYRSDSQWIKLSTGRDLSEHLVRQDGNGDHYDDIVDRKEETLVGFQIATRSNE